ncbi:MAG TPA: hypothetical protein VG799_01255 [Gemmatimonadota bacterium]|nr:hypothetical protein [Gemmatimonadota bacterium]
MHSFYRVLLVLHVAAGFTGLVAFWFPVFTPKGGRVHVRAGKVFLICAYVVAGTALSIALLTLASPFGTHPEARPADPARVDASLTQLRFLEAFLGYLAIVTFATVWHGVRVMRTRRERTPLRTPLHTAVGVIAILAGAGVLVLGLTFDQEARWILLALSPIGFLVGSGMLRYARGERKERMAHWYEHLGSMLGGGIAFHTAFAVFGIQRFVDYDLSGVVGLLPWILPSVVGAIAITIWTRHYRRKFGDLAPEEATLV